MQRKLSMISNGHTHCQIISWDCAPLKTSPLEIRTVFWLYRLSYTFYNVSAQPTPWSSIYAWWKSWGGNNKRMPSGVWVPDSILLFIIMSVSSLTTLFRPGDQWTNLSGQSCREAQKNIFEPFPEPDAVRFACCGEWIQDSETLSASLTSGKEAVLSDDRNSPIEPFGGIF